MSRGIIGEGDPAADLQAAERLLAETRYIKVTQRETGKWWLRGSSAKRPQKPRELKRGADGRVWQEYLFALTLSGDRLTARLIETGKIREGL
jgi:hypothetical protein